MNNVLIKRYPVRNPSKSASTSSMALVMFLILASVVFADPGVLIESDNQTVLKVEYLGSSTDNDPILSVTGGKKFGGKVEGTWRGLTGKVPGFTEPNPGVAAGVAGAGPIGVTGFGSGSGYYTIGGHFRTGGSSQTTGINYGVEARALYGNNVYGIYAEGFGGTNQNWAAWFVGNTWSTGTYQGSDIMFKKNVEDYAEGLDKVMALRPKSYETRVEEFKNDLVLPKGRQVGLVAQDLQVVLPELVIDAQAPPRLTPEEMAAGVQKEGLKFKAVNYTGLIPVLIAAVQEQQAMLLEQRTQIEALRAEVAALRK